MAKNAPRVQICTRMQIAHMNEALEQKKENKLYHCKTPILLLSSVHVHNLHNNGKCLPQIKSPIKIYRN